MCLKDVFGSIYVFVHMVFVATGFVASQSSTDVLWPSCDIVVCGMPRLDIQCDTESKILINNMTSTPMDVRANANSYSNLRRICMGLSTCNTTNFCNQYQAHFLYINVSYICVKDKDVDKSCKEDAQVLTAKSGFISSLNYPSETKFRKCRWKIHVKPDRLIHIFLHEVLPISTAVSSNHCTGGLLFTTNDTCGQRFPTDPVCNEIGKTTITACSDVELLLSGNSESESMRFWLSYYVVERHYQTPFPQLQHFELYDVSITCKVNAKDEFVYKYEINSVTDGAADIDATNNTTIVQPSHELDTNVDYVTYIGLAVSLLILALIILIIAVCVRFRLFHRFSKSKDTTDTPRNLSKSYSQNGDVPLPDIDNINDLVTQSEPELQQGYSSVVDVLPHHMLTPSSTSPTYAEIEECSETGEKPKIVLANKKSIDNSKRKLPAKPKENVKIPIYCDIEDSYATDEKTQKPKETNFKQNQCEENFYLDYSHKKKFSNASNVYDECVAVGSNGHDVPYINTSQKCVEDSEYVTNTESFKGVPHSKTSKNEKNLSKKSQVVGKITNTYIPKSKEIIVKGKTDQNTENGVNAVKLKVKNDSVTSNSDSDDEICVIENELYEPFESAKV